MVRKYPEPKPEELKRIEEENKKKTRKPMNEEKIPLTNNGKQIELQYTTYGTKRTEPDKNEFVCTGLIGHDKYPFVTTKYCEDKAMGLGCKEIKNCEEYKKQKLLQKKHPEINWEDLSKNKKEATISPKKK